MVVSRAKSLLPVPGGQLRGRDGPAFPIQQTHAVNGHRIVPPFPDAMRTAVFGLGCFWHAERVFWQTPGVWSTAVGYTGGRAPYPTYDEVCSGLTGHAEAVLVVYHPAKISYGQLLAVFWTSHDPVSAAVTSQYRSAIYYADDAQRAAAEAARAARPGSVTTEITPAGPFYYAEPHHQQYL